MSYTPEELREWANDREESARNYPMDSNGHKRAMLGADQLRAHADALEKLKVAEEELSNERIRSVAREQGSNKMALRAFIDLAASALESANEYTEGATENAVSTALDAIRGAK